MHCYHVYAVSMKISANENAYENITANDICEKLILSTFYLHKNQIVKIK